MSHLGRSDQQPTTWPEGVIARYLNVAGATIDITETGPRDDSYPNATIAQCSGCPADAAKNIDWNTRPYSYAISDPEDIPVSQAAVAAEREARQWAQTHAEKCRAMARPSA